MGFVAKLLLRNKASKFPVCLLVLSLGGVEMPISKGMLRQYLWAVAVNLGLMNQEVADSLMSYNRDVFVRLLRARIDELDVESRSDLAFFSPDYYVASIGSVSHVLNNLDGILAEV